MRTRYLPRSLVALAISGILISSLCFAGNTNDINLPLVIFSLKSVSTLETEGKLYGMLDLNITIKNLSNASITLNRIDYDIYLGEKFVANETYEESLKISPNETKIIEINELSVNLSSFAKEDVERAISEGNWSFSGIAYFTTSLGEFKVPIYWKGITPISYTYTPTGKAIIEVRDESWNPIVNASIILISKDKRLDGTTNMSGLMEFSEIPFANYTIKVSKEDYLPYEGFFNLSKTVTVKVVQLSLSTKLKVEVRDEKANPIVGANVSLVSKEFGNFTKTTNTSGIVEFEIPRANYTLKISKKGYLSYEEPLDLSKSPIESKIIQLKPELTWWQQYWPYLIIGAIAVCIIIPVILRLKRKSP